MNAIPQITPDELRRRMEAGDKLRLIDVREDDEVVFGMIEGAEHIPMNDIPDRAQELGQEEPIVFICRSGARSQRVCEYLSHHGYRSVANLSGGMIGWYDSI
ncbi:rhodanese-like domain-containing protein [Paenibacillus spiritus]|uniref:Rhodanese-like domain-containing protein n=1 Tax=Paenibacillus spiritus TaxID=2496557 RepID=A0A5J5GA84_9BACL|nr:MULTISPECIES: rhodanese-like domain-containing protein [Paenibacillus]KAA9004015.1 rhodanese-like domain-containing protein [Paenibacillus spiritus]